MQEIKLINNIDLAYICKLRLYKRIYYLLVFYLMVDTS